MSRRDVSPDLSLRHKEGHEVGCQCGVCRRMRGESRTKRQVPVPAPARAQTPASVIEIGGKFIYNTKRYQKIAIVDGATRAFLLVEKEGELFTDSSIRIDLTPECLVEEVPHVSSS